MGRARAGTGSVGSGAPSYGHGSGPRRSPVDLPVHVPSSDPGRHPARRSGSSNVCVPRRRVSSAVDGPGLYRSRGGTPVRDGTGRRHLGRKETRPQTLVFPPYTLPSHPSPQVPGPRGSAPQTRGVRTGLESPPRRRSPGRTDCKTRGEPPGRCRLDGSERRPELGGPLKRSGSRSSLRDRGTAPTGGLRDAGESSCLRQVPALRRTVHLPVSHSPPLRSRRSEHDRALRTGTTRTHGQTLKDEWFQLLSFAPFSFPQVWGGVIHLPSRTVTNIKTRLKSHGTRIDEVGYWSGVDDPVDRPRTTVPVGGESGTCPPERRGSGCRSNPPVPPGPLFSLLGSPNGVTLTRGRP